MAAQGGTAVEGAGSRLGVVGGRLAFSEPALPPWNVIITIHYFTCRYVYIASYVLNTSGGGPHGLPHTN